ncbi:cysteine desulfurase [Sesbania bispinosa]|nr:cysteine desulfurase [Sesbania bispinosa]
MVSGEYGRRRDKEHRVSELSDVKGREEVGIFTGGATCAQMDLQAWKGWWWRCAGEKGKGKGWW